MITFILLRAIPGDVAVAVLGPSSYRNPQVLAAFNRAYGFDRPWFDQYLLWLGHLLQGNPGFSWTLDQRVSSLLGSHLDCGPRHGRQSQLSAMHDDAGD